VKVRSGGRRDAQRQSLREALIAARQAMDPAHRAACAAAIESGLERLLDRLSPNSIGFCWPFRGEFDCRPLVTRRIQRGILAALPLIVAPAAPMVFKEWSPQAPMTEGRFGIPVPAAGDTLVPELVLLPLNGFDRLGYRLGYGGGYFDRTLASLSPTPIAVGVGFELARLDSIQPEAHDVPLDYVVTEAGVFVRSEAGLARMG
jgi:5,10-methenyltetrahydrofolate synthetase